MTNSTPIIPPEGYALLDAIAVGESGDGESSYRIMFGGGHFAAPPWIHPNVAVPIPGSDLHSTAAGRYQFLHSTWEAQAAKLGLGDFSTMNQDLAAWDLAQEDYARRCGRKLLGDLVIGHTAFIGGILHPTWTSMGDSTFPGRYSQALAQRRAQVTAPSQLPPGDIRAKLQAAIGILQDALGNLS